MPKRYPKALKVSKPNGERIYANITPVRDAVHIEVGFLEAVQKDNPPFAQNGIIRFQVPKATYKETLGKLTSYIESLLLKELDEEEKVNEDIYSSLGIKPSSGRNKKAPKPRQTERIIGTGDSPSVHSSARGGKSSESSGSGKPSTDVDEGGNSQADGQD
jgi:hypothetical protein